MKGVMEPTRSTAELVMTGSVLHAGRLITEIENGREEARQTVRQLMRSCGKAQLIGVTGPPGAGKSTLVAALIRQLRLARRTVGVVAVDPSSPLSGGALLGDRDRMLEAASGDRDVFIRSLASRGAVGGLAAAVNDAVDVMDAMGKHVVIIETVGVGQGEFDIARIAHTVVLVLVPGYGDALQVMKAGITEIADVIVVNKGDLPEARQAVKELKSHGFAQRGPRGGACGGSGGGEPWQVPVIQASALRQEGIADIVAAVNEHYLFTGSSGWRLAIERGRRRAQFADVVAARLRAELMTTAEQALDDRQLADPCTAAEEFVRHVMAATTRAGEMERR